MLQISQEQLPDQEFQKLSRWLADPAADIFEAVIQASIHKQLISLANSVETRSSNILNDAGLVVAEQEYLKAAATMKEALALFRSLRSGHMKLQTLKIQV